MAREGLSGSQQRARHRVKEKTALTRVASASLTLLKLKGSVIAVAMSIFRAQYEDLSNKSRRASLGASAEMRAIIIAFCKRTMCPE